MTQNLCLRCVPWKEELKWTPELKKKNPKTGLTHLNLHAQSSAAHTQHQNDNTEGSHFSDDARGLCRFLLWSQVICAASYKACRQISEWFINNSLRRLKVRWHWLVGDNPKAAAAVDPLFSLFYSPHPLSLLFITSISLFPPSEQCSVIDFGIHTNAHDHSVLSNKSALLPFLPQIFVTKLSDKPGVVYLLHQTM